MTTQPKKPKGARKTTTMTDQTAIDTANATPTKRTLDEKIALTQALLAKYIAERDNVQAVQDLEVGDVVTFNYGRPIGSKVLSGTVQAVGDSPVFGLTAAVLVGEGLDATVVKTPARHITANATADARQAANPVEAPADDSDPLNAE